MDTSTLNWYNLPPKEGEPKPLDTPRKYEAFYASQLSESKDKAGAYESIIDEVSRRGYSPILDDVRREVKNKADMRKRQAAFDIATDPSLPVKQRQAKITVILGEGDGSIEEEYLQNIGPKIEDRMPKEEYQFPIAGSKEDRRNAEVQKGFFDRWKEAGGKVIDQFNFALETAKRKGFTDTLKDSAEVAGTMTSGLGLAIAGGVVGAWVVATEQDGEKANAIFQSIMESIYKGDGEGYEAGMKALDAIGKFIDVPFRSAGDATHDYLIEHGYPELANYAATTVYTVPQAFGYAAGGYGAVRAFTKGATVYQAVKEGVKAASPIPPKRPDVVGPTPGSPYDKVKHANAEKAVELAVEAILDPTGKKAAAMGTTKAELIQDAVLPQLDPEIREIKPDVGNRLEALDDAFSKLFEAERIDPYLFNVDAIKKDLDSYVDTLSSQSKLYTMMSSSYIEPTGKFLKGHLIFGKSENKGFDLSNDYGRQDMFDAYVELQQAIIKEHGDKPKPNITRFDDPVTGQSYLVWKFNKAYDTTQNTFLGTGSIEANFGPAKLTWFPNTELGKFFFGPATRLPEWLTAGMTRAAIRATNLEKHWSGMIKEFILPVKKSRELAGVIYKAEETGEYQTLPMIRKMYPHLTKSEIDQIYTGYNAFRRINQQMYIVTNSIYRRQKVAAGFNGLYDKDGKYLDYLGKRVMPDKEGNVILKTQLDADVKDVFDFSRDQPRAVMDIDFKTVPVYKLDQPKIVDGVRYTYAIGAEAGGIPGRILPEIPEYFPHINKEPYFIKAVPRTLYIDGVPVPKEKDGLEVNRDIYTQNGITVHVAKTEKAANKIARELGLKDPDNEYRVVFERTQVNDEFAHGLSAMKFNRDVMRSRKKERLTHPDGTLSTLEDPLKALYSRMQSTAKMYSFKDIDYEFRENWKRSFSFLVTNPARKGFPETMDDIQLPTGATPFEKDLYKAAKETFEQYAKQQRRTEGWSERKINDLLIGTARMLEDYLPKASEWLLNQYGKGDPIMDTALRFNTFRHIHTPFLRQWLVQPGQVFELAGLRATKGDIEFTKHVNTVGWAVWRDVVLGSDAIKERLPALFNSFKEPNSLFAGISKEELASIVDAFKASGVANSINMHSVVDGVFQHAESALDVTKVEAALQKTKGVTSGAIELPRRIGFDGAELFNQIGLWLYARRTFMEENPGVNWNTPTNRERIAVKAWGVGNSMLGRGDILPYQEGMLRALMQFEAYGNKALLQPLTSRFLTKDEKLRLAAFRLMAYGEKGVAGGIAFSQVMEKIREAMYEESPKDMETRQLIDSIIEYTQRGWGDLVANGFLNTFLRSAEEKEEGIKTDLELMKSFAPGGKYTLSAGDKAISVMNWIMSEEKFSQVSTIGSTGVAVVDTAIDLVNSFKADEIEPKSEGELMARLRILAKLAGGWNHFEKHMAMKATEDMVDRYGKSLGMKASGEEIVAALFGVSSYKSTVLYESEKLNTEMDKAVQSKAKEAVRLLDYIEDTRGVADEPLAVDELRFRIKSIANMMEENGLGPEYYEAIVKELGKDVGKGRAKLIDKLLKRKGTEITGNRLEAMKKLQSLEGRVGKDATRHIQQLYSDFSALEEEHRKWEAEQRKSKDQ